DQDIPIRRDPKHRAVREPLGERRDASGHDVWGCPGRRGCRRSAAGGDGDGCRVVSGTSRMSVERVGNVSALQLDGSSTVAWADAPAGASDAIVVLGRDDAGAGAIQVGIARLATRPTKGVL